MSQVSAQEILFRQGDFTLNGLAYGKPSDPMVLCLHGWLDNAASFLPLMPHLTGKYVVVIEWPGHGFSTHRSDDAHYHFIDYIYDLLILFESEQWLAVDIIAHSMGGMIASAFAAAFPEKVRTLTLIDSIGFISAKAEQSTKNLRQGMLSRLKNSQKRKSVHSDINSAINARMQVSDLSFEHAKLLVERGSIPFDSGVVWRSDSRLRNSSPYRLTLRQAKTFISDIKCPVQLIYGDNGLDMISEGLALFGPLFENFTHHELAGGHHIHMEKPEQTAGFILNFLEKV